MRNLVLLLASLFFYFYGEPVYGLLMLASILSGYLHGLWIGKNKGSRAARLPLIFSVVTSIGMLIFFKYSDFFIENVNPIFSLNIPCLRIPLPIGISFYTFQILSYTIDVYRDEAKVQKNILDFATYVSLFPQLIAGPIVRYTDVENELRKRTHSLEEAAYGIWRFVIGLSKKVIMANSLGQLVKIISETAKPSVAFYWMSAVAFTLQIYYDFSGYSDMAIGLGRIFGFHFLENFNYPYISKSITEFWRRWHMSLGSWFRDYVYIPMGGNRVGRLKWIRNILVVWFLTGFWHGAQWNFIIWGLYFAVLLIAEKYLKGFLDRLPSVIRHLYVAFFILISFALFNADSLAETVQALGGMFGFTERTLINDETVYYASSYIGTFAVAIIGATPIPAKLADRLCRRSFGWRLANVLKPLLIALLLLIVTGYLIDGSFNPFLYFRF